MVIMYMGPLVKPHKPKHQNPHPGWIDPSG